MAKQLIIKEVCGEIDEITGIYLAIISLLLRLLMIWWTNVDLHLRII